MDVQQEIEATRRGVEGTVVALSRTYPTDVADLWEALTDPARLPRWFLPVSGELRLGGRYQIEGNAGGTITACTPPTGFDATWEIGEQVSRIEVRLGADGGGARLELTHVAPDDDHWRRYGPSALGIGWDLALTLGLAAHVASGVAVDPAEAMAWTASPEGAEFIAASGRAWEHADPAGDAHARAERTIAFLGAQPPHR